MLNGYVYIADVKVDVWFLKMADAGSLIDFLGWWIFCRFLLKSSCRFHKTARCKHVFGPIFVLWNFEILWSFKIWICLLNDLTALSFSVCLFLSLNSFQHLLFERPFLVTLHCSVENFLSYLRVLNFFSSKCKQLKFPSKKQHDRCSVVASAPRITHHLH